MIQNLIHWFTTIWTSMISVVDFMQTEISLSFLDSFDVFTNGSITGIKPIDGQEQVYENFAIQIPESISMFELMFGGLLFLYLTISVVKWVKGLII